MRRHTHCHLLSGSSAHSAANSQPIGRFPVPSRAGPSRLPGLRLTLVRIYFVLANEDSYLNPFALASAMASRNDPKQRLEAATT